MELNLSQLQAVATGAVYVSEYEGGFLFHRFTKEQEEFYRLRDAGHYLKTFAPTGVTLHFKTNSTRLFLQVETANGSSRYFFSFDVFVNGKMVGSMDNFTGVDLPYGDPTVKLPLGAFEKEFDLGPGEKELKVYLPFSTKTVVKTVALDDGALITPIKPAKKLLAFGDSITHGYDALHPSNKYITQLAEALDAEEFNKGIGGERFTPGLAGLAALRDPFDPDYVTLAYGTNDWSHRALDEFTENCRDFYTTLSAQYPNAKIYAITPIWRKDCTEDKKMGAFEEVAKCITAVTADLPNVTVVPGFDLVPHEESLYADLRLHPNDEGFAHYGKNLIAAIR